MTVAGDVLVGRQEMDWGKKVTGETDFLLQYFFDRNLNSGLCYGKEHACYINTLSCILILWMSVGLSHPVAMPGSKLT